MMQQIKSLNYLRRQLKKIQNFSSFCASSNIDNENLVMFVLLHLMSHINNISLEIIAGNISY